MLREDYVDLLQREADARIRILNHKDQPEKVKQMEERVMELEVALKKAEEVGRTSAAEVEHQKRLTAMAMEDVANVVDPSSGDAPAVLVSEVAKFRGEAARIEVELGAAKKRVSMLSAKLKESQAKAVSLEGRLAHMEGKERDATMTCQQAKRELLDMQAKYHGGASAEEMIKVRKEREELMADRERLHREADR